MFRGMAFVALATFAAATIDRASSFNAPSAFVVVPPQTGGERMRSSSSSSSTTTAPHAAAISERARSSYRIVPSRLPLMMATVAEVELLHRSLLEARIKYDSASASKSIAEAPAFSAPPEGQKKARGGGIGGGKGKASAGKDLGPTIYVGNLSFDSKEDEIRELFEKHGTVTRVTVPLNRETGKSRGFAFVSMESVDDLNKAVEALDQTQFQGRTLYVNESKPKEEQKKDLEQSKLYVGNISYDTTKDDLIQYFSEFGTVMDVYIPLKRQSATPRGFAFVNMAEDDIENAIQGTDGKVYKGRSLTVSVSLPRGQKATPRETREMKLYVGNLSFYTDIDAVRSLFEEYGTVNDCYMPVDRETGRPRGFAFVTMDPDAAMRAADETDGYEMDGRIIRVNPAQPKGYSSPSSGGRYSSDMDGGGDGYYDGSSDGDSWGDNNGGGEDSWGGNN